MEHIIRFDISKMPTTLYADYGVCRKPMIHTDRIANHDILLFVLSGCIPVIEDGHEYFLKPGDIFFLKKGIHHWGKINFIEGTSWFFIHFKIDEPSNEIPEFSANLRRKKNVHFDDANYQRVITLPKHLSNMLNTDVGDKIRKVVELFNSDKPYQLAHVNTRLHELLVDIYIQKQTLESSDTTTARTQRIYRFLQEQTENPFEPKEIEAFIGLSYKHIGKIFKEETGMTLHECHTGLKIDRATWLLCSTDMQISEISQRLGYSDPLYFSNVIKKHTGLSPRAYRNRYSGAM